MQLRVYAVFSVIQWGSEVISETTSLCLTEHGAVTLKTREVKRRGRRECAVSDGVVSREWMGMGLNGGRWVMGSET